MLSLEVGVGHDGDLTADAIADILHDEIPIVTADEPLAVELMSARAFFCGMKMREIAVEPL